MVNIILAEHINIVVVSLLACWCSILLKASLVQPDRAANMTLFCWSHALLESPERMCLVGHNISDLIWVYNRISITT